MFGEHDLGHLVATVECPSVNAGHFVSLNNVGADQCSLRLGRNACEDGITLVVKFVVELIFDILRRIPGILRFRFPVKDQRNPLPILHPRPALRIRRNMDRLEVSAAFEYVVRRIWAFAKHRHIRKVATVREGAAPNVRHT